MFAYLCWEVEVESVTVFLAPPSFCLAWKLRFILSFDALLFRFLPYLKATKKLVRNLALPFVCLFVLGFNVSLTLFQSYCDGTCIRQVRMLQHWNAHVAGT